jgi:hypothetical protein
VISGLFCGRLPTEEKMQFIRKTFMFVLLCAVMGVLWLAAADKASPGAPVVLRPDGSATYETAIARNTSRPPVLADPNSLVSVLRSLFVS